MNVHLIVCLVDLSSEDKTVLQQSLALARWHDADLHVVHVESRRRPDRSGDEVDAHLAALVESLEAKDVLITPAIRSGDPIKVVAEYTQRMFADLLVVGQSGRGVGRSWSAGALAGAIARAVACPTFMVPPSKEPQEIDPSFKNIVCGVDFTFTSLHALDQALGLAHASGGQITLVNVLGEVPNGTVYSGGEAMRLTDDYRAWVRRARERLHALVPPDAFYRCEVDAVALSGTPHGGILRIASERKADLIVIGNPKRARSELIAMGSAVRGVLRGARVPVLTVPGLDLAPAQAERVARPDKEPVLPRRVRPGVPATSDHAQTPGSRSDGSERATPVM